MTTRWALLSVSSLALLCACGGSDSTIPDGSTGDGSPMDGNGGMDGNGNQDTGTDTGTMNDGGNNSDAGNLNVAAVPCVILWLDAAKGVTQTNNQVSGWADQTSNANNAQQGIAQRQPTLTANVINGLPAIHFNRGSGNQGSNGNMVTIADSTTLQWGHNDFGVWVVGRFDNDPQDGQTRGVGVLFSKFTNNGNPPNFGPLLFANNAAGNQIVAGLTGAVSTGNIFGASSSYNDNKARSYGLRRTGNTIELRVNGSQTAMLAQNGAVDVSSTGVVARIGADGDASLHRLNGDVAEVVACKGTMAANDLAALDAYFQAKYNL